MRVCFESTCLLTELSLARQSLIVVMNNFKDEKVLLSEWQKMGAHGCTCGDILPESKLVAISRHTLH